VISCIRMRTQPTAGAPWWKTAVFYQVYPRSFADSNGDGIGDLEGLRQRLHYLTWLGVDAIWLSPFYPSPMADFGYDVADYCDVDPVFGSPADFDRLLAEAHQRKLKVIVDWVPNHTSDQHPWFIESRSSRDNPKRDWYVWVDGSPDRLPSGWGGSFGKGPAWTWDERTQAWYLHLHLPQQPDLNWENPQVVEAMHDVLRFWLDRGVDGFRADVIHLIGKDPTSPEHPEVGTPQRLLETDRRSQRLIRGIRALLDSYPGERMMVGEVYILDTPRVATFTAPDLLHLAFHFPPLWSPWDAEAWRYQLDATYREVGTAGGWPTWVLSNHDVPRHRSRYGSEGRARAAAVLLLTQRGTPFLYAGEELGLQNAVIPPERTVDVAGRDVCRAPIPWDPTPIHGWHSDPWLPWPPEPERYNAATLREDQTSIVHLYRRLLRARRESRALQVGEWKWLPSVEGALAYERQFGDDRRAVVVNFTDDKVRVPLDESWHVDVASDGVGEGKPYSGVVAPSAALLMSRRQ
jgi:alpha-glucosidase